MTRIALIHALSHSVAPINEAFARDWPEAVRMNLLDDSLSADLARNGRGLDAAMHERFQRLAQYAVDTGDRKSTRLNSSHLVISYAVFCLKKKNNSCCRRV